MGFSVPKRKTSKKAAPKKKLAIRGKVARAFTFDKLVSTISGIHDSLANQAAKAVNISLTLRNWLIGFYIAEYELHGADRASYGDQIIDRLSTELQKGSLPRCDRRELYRYRQLYCIYPQIVETVSPQFALDENAVKIQGDTIVETLSPQLKIPAKDLIEKLSFSGLRNQPLLLSAACVKRLRACEKSLSADTS